MHSMAMSMREARGILDIPSGTLTAKIVRTAYHRLALKHHPDMPGGTNDAFVKINGARDVLLEQTNKSGPEYSQATDPSPEKVVQLLLADLTSVQILAIWALLQRTETDMFLGEATAGELRRQIAQRSNIITVRPTLASSLSQLVHPLDIGEEVVYVPLWHSHVEFECKGRVIIVHVDTILPPHIAVDSDNTMHVNITHRASLLLKMGYLDICIADRDFRLPASRVRMVGTQTVSLGHVGLPRINCRDTLDVSVQMEIIVHLNLSLN